MPNTEIRHQTRNLVYIYATLFICVEVKNLPRPTRGRSGGEGGGVEE